MQYFAILRWHKKEKHGLFIMIGTAPDGIWAGRFSDLLKDKDYTSIFTASRNGHDMYVKNNWCTLVECRPLWADSQAQYHKIRHILDNIIVGGKAAGSPKKGFLDLSQTGYKSGRFLGCICNSPDQFIEELKFLRTLPGFAECPGLDDIVSFVLNGFSSSFLQEIYDDTILFSRSPLWSRRWEKLSKSHQDFFANDLRKQAEGIYRCIRSVMDGIKMREGAARAAARAAEEAVQRAQEMRERIVGGIAQRIQKLLRAHSELKISVEQGEIILEQVVRELGEIYPRIAETLGLSQVTMAGTAGHAKEPDEAEVAGLVNTLSAVLMEEIKISFNPEGGEVPVDCDAVIVRVSEKDILAAGTIRTAALVWIKQQQKQQERDSATMALAHSGLFRADRGSSASATQQPQQPGLRERMAVGLAQGAGSEGMKIGAKILGGLTGLPI